MRWNKVEGHYPSPPLRPRLTRHPVVMFVVSFWQSTIEHAA